MTLYLAPELDAADQRVLRGIAVSRKELGYRLAQPCRWQGQFRRTLTARAIRGSNSIEGYQVSLDDAEDAVEHEPPLEGSIVPPEIVGYRDALTFVQQLAGAPHFRYERMLLSALHFLMLDHRLDISPGRYRTGTTFVRNNQTHEVVYEGPEPERVPGLVDELLDWLAHGDADAPVYVRAAMAHLNLVNIHPWRDGNGRMSRCLHTLVLARDGVLAPEFASIEEWLGSGRNTYDYHDACARWAASGGLRTRRVVTPTRGCGSACVLTTCRPNWYDAGSTSTPGCGSSWRIWPRAAVCPNAPCTHCSPPLAGSGYDGPPTSMTRGSATARRCATCAP